MNGDGVARVSARVKWFNTKKGFGFAERGSGADVFLHQNNLPQGVDHLDEGQEISFVVEETRKGLRALEIRVT